VRRSLTEGGVADTAPEVTLARIACAVADETHIPLAEELEEIGAQLDWVRGYL
jgi:hypothetical protein